MKTPVNETPSFNENAKTDQLIGWALAALLVCFLAYLAAVYVFQPEEDTDYVHEALPQDPPRPAEPFVWGSVPETKPLSPVEADSGPEMAEGGTDTASQADSGPSSLPGIGSREVSYAFFAGPNLKRVRRETVRALERGETQIWKAGNERGYVLVSTPRYEGIQECRQVSYSLFDGPRQSLSPAMQWCREGRRDWQPN